MTTETIKATFTLPDTLTVRQQLKFAAEIGKHAQEGYLIAYWEMGKTVLTNWQCDLIPDPSAVDIDTETDPRITKIIIKAANEVAKWYLDLGNVEKN